MALVTSVSGVAGAASSEAGGAAGFDLNVDPVNGLDLSWRHRYSLNVTWVGFNGE